MTVGAWRGLTGAIDPEDRVRMDQAIEVAETIEARQARIIEAETASTTAAGQAAEDRVATGQDRSATQTAREAAETASGNAAAMATPYATVVAATSATKPTPVLRVSAMTAWGAVTWLRKSGGPCLGGGWIPDGDVYPDHFADNANPGVTDMSAAILAALAYAARVNLCGDYGVGSTIRFDNRHLVGTHSRAWPHRAKLVGLTAALPIGDAIIAPGRTSSVEHIAIGYNTIAGTEGPNERVGLDVRGNVYGLQRGSWINDILFDMVGTAVSDFDGGGSVFSASFGSIEVTNYSYSGIWLGGHFATGTDWGNWYIGNPASTAFTPAYGVRFGDRISGGSFRQLNIEHAAFTVSPAWFAGVRGLSISNLHLEGVDLLTSGAAYIHIGNTSLTIDNLTVFHTRCTADQTSLIGIGNGRYDLIGTYGGQSNFGYLRIGTLMAKGISDPNIPMYPDYASTRRGLDKVVGWTWLRRSSSEPNANYIVSIGHYDYASYQTAPGDISYYSPLTTAGNILLDQLGPRADEAAIFQPYSATINLYRPYGVYTIGVLTGDTTVTIPAGIRTGQTVTLALLQDTTGGRIVNLVAANGAHITGTIPAGGQGRRAVATYRYLFGEYILEGFSGWIAYE